LEILDGFHNNVGLSVQQFYLTGIIEALELGMMPAEGSIVRNPIVT
jgi:hypothetical protein